MDFVIHRRVDHSEEFHPVIDLLDIILRVPRASILRELHLSLTTLFALRFPQYLNGVRLRRLVFSPEGGICLPVCVSHRTLGQPTLQSPEGDTRVRCITLLTPTGAPRPSKLPHLSLIVSPLRA